MTRSADTAPDSDRASIEALRQMGESGRFALTLRLIATAREALMDGIRARHPDYTEEQLRLAFARQVLGDELFHAAYEGRPALDP